MAVFVSISGPSVSGKSTLHTMVASRLQDCKDTVIVTDLHDDVWKSLCDRGIFQEFTEITVDRDYLLMYTSKVVDHYANIINEYKDKDVLVLLDGCHIDILIYSMLNLWYHYPAKEYMEQVVDKILSLKDYVSLVYMTRASSDVNNVPRASIRCRMTSFKRNRRLELSYYDMARCSNKVVSLSTESVLGEDQFIVDDLLLRRLIKS